MWVQSFTREGAGSDALQIGTAKHWCIQKLTTSLTHTQTPLLNTHTQRAANKELADSLQRREASLQEAQAAAERAKERAGRDQEAAVRAATVEADRRLGEIRGELEREKARLLKVCFQNTLYLVRLHVFGTW